MARARNIKPSLFKNEVLGVADPLLTILFESLWCLADREGRLEDRPLRIKGETFPYREGIDVNGYLTELARMGFIRRYKVGETAVIQVLKFKEHQSPHNTEKKSTLPAYDEKATNNQSGETVTVKPPLSDVGITEQKRPDSLIPDSLIPDKYTGTPAQKKKTDGENPTVKTLIDLGVNPQAAKDWLIVRKAKDGPFTQTALDDLIREAGKAGITVAQAVLICARKNWRGFNASWDWRDAMPKKTAAELLDESEAARH